MLFKGSLLHIFLKWLEKLIDMLIEKLISFCKEKYRRRKD